MSGTSAPDSDPIGMLTIAISSSALFDLNESNRVYEEEGLEAYRRYQIAHEDKVLERGEAFNFVDKFLNINKLLDKHRVEVILLSRNSADTGLRIFNSIAAHDLEITRAAFCGGESPYRYIHAFGGSLFLSTQADDVAHALKHGVAAATLLGGRSGSEVRAEGSEELRLAFDGDSVLFPTRLNRSIRARALMPLPKPNGRKLPIPWKAARSRSSCGRCTICNGNFLRASARFEPRW